MAEIVPEKDGFRFPGQSSLSRPWSQGQGRKLLNNEDNYGDAFPLQRSFLIIGIASIAALIMLQNS